MRKPALSIAAAALALLPLRANAMDDLRFQLSWRPQAEHGCFYQAVGADIYQKHGMNVTIEPGGPQINTQQILASGKVEFAMGSNSFNGFNYVRESIPMVVIAAVFQKDPQGVMTHVGVGHDSLVSLSGTVPVFVSNISRSTWWPFLRAKYGFKDEQMRPYTFNLAPFLADKNSAQQGFITNEPFQADAAGFKTNFFLLADEGYADYAYTIETSRAMAEQKPELVQRFVDASIEGCYSYLFGDPQPGNALILAANPQMTAENVAYSIMAMKERGLVAGGDAAKLGIGAMTDARWAEFFDFAVKAGLYQADLDYKRGYMLNFVNKRHGLTN
jgi:NitT/TauT family transport system substrate-binding protein